MKIILQNILLLILFSGLSITMSQAQVISSPDGNTISPDGEFNRNGDRDSTEHKLTPRGITVWTVDEITGDKYEAEPDTAWYMHMNTVFASGVYGEYNTLGNNGSTRQNRIFIDRQDPTDFPFLNGFSQVLKPAGDFHFTNTYSPITNLSYNECGTQITGEDHLKAIYAINANKRLGFGFKIDYLYSRGYYANQNLSHFNFSIWESYHGARYENHFLFSTNHQKQTENGGIINDNYIKHPELSPQSFAENEIPTVLENNWNINDNQHIFFTQRYNVGFNRRVPMTEKEKEAKRFAMQAEEQKKKREEQRGRNVNEAIADNKVPAPAGRPDNAKIIGDEPEQKDSVENDRLAMTVEEANAKAEEDKKKKEDDVFMKDEYVPVTSFFHTANIGIYRRNYRAYTTPENYYANDYYNLETDSIEDRTDHTYIRNNLGVSLLEGFNKWAKAGVNVYAGHEFRNYTIPIAMGQDESWSENSLVLGGELIKRQGETLHFNARGEFYALGTDVGQVHLNGNADVNFKLLGDTVRLDANASLNIDNPDSYYFKYSSRHFKWDLPDLSMTKHLHIEGNLSLKRTQTRLRFAFDNISDYTYFGTHYTLDEELNHIATSITPRQLSDVQVITAQLYQKLHYKILHWDNIITYQKTSNETSLPLPSLNWYTNLYLRFKIARVLDTDFGADMRYFTEYYAPEYSPAIQSFVIQENDDIRVKTGNYPIVNVYLNFQLKTCRFFLMMSHINCSGKGNFFLTPHHPLNQRVLRFGLNWNFYN